MLNKKTKDSILFTGYYEMQNTGDDAFCAISAWGAKNYWKAKNIEFLCRNIPELPVIAKPALHSRDFFRGQRQLELLHCLSKKPTIIFAGGSVFHSQASVFSYRSIISKCKKLTPITLGAIGVSLGPFTSMKARKDVEKFLSQFSFLALRDRSSYEEACSMKLSCQPVEAFDLAALLPDVYGPAKSIEHDKRDGATILGVSLCNSERYVGGDLSNEQRREEQIVKTLKTVAQRVPVIVRFLVFNGNETYGDMELTKKVAAVISDYTQTEIVPYSRDPITMWRKIGECSAVFSTRLHAGIFSCIAGVPFLQVEYHKKCSEFLNEIQYPGQWRIGDMQISPEEAALTLISMLDKHAYPLGPDLVKLKEKAELNFTEVNFRQELQR